MGRDHRANSEGGPDNTPDASVVGGRQQVVRRYLGRYAGSWYYCSTRLSLALFRGRGLSRAVRGQVGEEERGGGWKTER